MPLLLWFSAGAPAHLQLDTACLRNHLHDAVSHDNLSHTLLGLDDVNTHIYRPQLDLLRACRSKV